jgi:hypothetical protein
MIVWKFRQNQWENVKHNFALSYDQSKEKNWTRLIILFRTIKEKKIESTKSLFGIVSEIAVESWLWKKIGWSWCDEIIHLNIFRLYLSFSMKRRHYLYVSLLNFLNLKGGDISKASVHCRNWSSLEETNCLYITKQIKRFKKQLKSQRLKSTLPISKSHSCLFSVVSFSSRGSLRFALEPCLWAVLFGAFLFKVSNGSSFLRWSWKIQRVAVVEPWISRQLLVGSRGRRSMCSIKFFIVSETSHKGRGRKNSNL